VPGCEEKNTNKGAIIHAAARYIQDLKHNEASNIEKWTLEKLLMDQAMGDLTAQLDDARAQIDRLRAELDNRYSHQIPPDHHKS
jgi:bHLH factor